MRTWKQNGDSVSVDYGPLTFSLEIGQKWVKYGGTDALPEQEVYPTTPWNYGLVLDAKDPAASFEVVAQAGPAGGAAVHAGIGPDPAEGQGEEDPATGRRTSNNLIRPLQPSPAASGEPTETVTLIPMGAARLRISAFPVIGEGANGPRVEGRPPPSGPTVPPAGPSPRRRTSSDTVSALNDGQVPESSSDQDVPRFTWWDHKGTSEWVQYDFKQPEKVSAVEVYWFDDTGKGECRVPQSWTVLYKDGDEWKPVEGASECGTKRDAFNRLTFKPVQTTALRLQVQLQPDVSAGILEWKVN